MQVSGQTGYVEKYHKLDHSTSFHQLLMPTTCAYVANLWGHARDRNKGQLVSEMLTKL